MKTAKMFWQNQKTVLKKKTFIHLFQWICVPYLKLFRKLIFFWSNYESPLMRILVRVTTEKEIKNVRKQSKTKKHLFKMLQKNKKQKIKNSSNKTSKMTWIVIKKSDIYHQNFWKKNLFQRHHDNSYANHFNQIRILILLKKQYSWPEIFQKIKKYCDSCIICHRIKFVKHKPHQLIKILSQLQGFWTDVIMDFIIDLSSSDKSKTVFDFILIVMNKCFLLSFNNEIEI